MLMLRGDVCFPAALMHDHHFEHFHRDKCYFQKVHSCEDAHMQKYIWKLVDTDAYGEVSSLWVLSV